MSDKTPNGTAALALKCGVCDRGREACEWCHDLAEEDFEAICDCGLWDFEEHLFDCEVRIGRRWVVRQ